MTDTLTEQSVDGGRSDVADRTGTWCVIGAGSSGLAVAKNLREHGFDVECFEREQGVGGNWNARAASSRVYASTHTISSKPFTQYADFPMPDEFPDYPHHSQLLAYFQAYQRHFGLDEVIRFGHTVQRVEPVPDGGGWHVTVQRPDGGSQRARYAGVVVANGHNWYPKRPDYAGLDGFTGEVLHSADYKDPQVLRERRVLVVGAGNTGCDIAVEAAQNAARTLHSTRRGYWYAPKYTFGRPADQVADSMLALRLPLKVRQWLFKATLRLTVGDLTRHGLVAPDHDIFETHPIVNSQLVYYIGHGDITPKPEVQAFDGAQVRFSDGSTEPVDVVVFATGYLVRFDFVDNAHLNWRDGRPRLYQHVFTPAHDTLFVAGLIQPDSGQFALAHWQAVAIAGYLEARRDRPQVAARFRERVARDAERVYSGGAHYTESTRHYFEIAHQHYLKAVEDTIEALAAPR